MSNESLSLKAREGAGSLFETNGFLIPVLSGSHREMGVQYGALMVESMQQAYDTVIQPQFDSGSLTASDAAAWTQRAVTTFSARNKEFYAGMVEGTGWPLDKVGILDQINEYGVFQSKLHSFAGCTSIMSWGGSSADEKMYVGRNMDWSAAYNEFPQTLTVLNPTDGSYRYANLGWPGMINVFTALNEHGVYVDLHDGTSMGGSVVYEDRAPSLDALTDAFVESASLDALVRRLNASRASMAVILSLADESGAVSMECAGHDNRARLPDGESLVTVNTFLIPDWGMRERDTVSHSLERLSNMTDRLAERHGSIDAAMVRDLMDMTLFDSEGNLDPNGGATKPTKIDADQTTHQMVTDVVGRKVWLKVPNPKYFADWTPVDLAALWS
ncbi:MAG: C45 family autoproteolytic acyltransferase/hydrolase [Acidimicrobiia bacterium]|nr:C45 family autoproteolytic acyltransferase/hydrolase [Acidimicrobiia bacterium]